MKLVALVSGGKDSIYSICCARKESHEIICLGHISSYNMRKAIENFKHDEDEGIIGYSTELDSWMYQSIGSEMIPFLSVALDKPIFVSNKEDIEPTEIEIEDDYKYLKKFGDEVDYDIVRLFRLLRYIKNIYPEIEGVISGAIFSNYQKIRIDLVCRSLGLQSVTPLWHIDQPKLLDEMISNGMKSVLVKVSSLGLVKKHLMKYLDEVQNELLDLFQKYGVHVCGEGGEYETFTLDCPEYKNKIVVDEYETVMLDDNVVSQVAVIKFLKCHLESKKDGSIVPVSFLKLLENKQIVIVD